MGRCVLAVSAVLVGCGSAKAVEDVAVKDVVAQDAGMDEGPAPEDVPEALDAAPDTAEVTSPPPDAGPACVELLPGSWRLSGECVSMVLWFDATWSDCQLELTSLTHPMGQPTSASVAGATVTFHGGTWKGCQGTVTDGPRIDATCTACGTGEAGGFTLLHAE